MFKAIIVGAINLINICLINTCQNISLSFRTPAPVGAGGVVSCRAYIYVINQCFFALKKIFPDIRLDSICCAFVLLIIPLLGFNSSWTWTLLPNPTVYTVFNSFLEVITVLYIYFIFYSKSEKFSSFVPFLVFPCRRKPGPSKLFAKEL
jgi:hypothetical protein